MFKRVSFVKSDKTGKTRPSTIACLKWKIFNVGASIGAVYCITRVGEFGLSSAQHTSDRATHTSQPLKRLSAESGAKKAAKKHHDCSPPSSWPPLPSSCFCWGDDRGVRSHGLLWTGIWEVSKNTVYPTINGWHGSTGVEHSSKSTGDAGEVVVEVQQQLQNGVLHLQILKYIHVKRGPIILPGVSVISQERPFQNNARH